MAKTNANMAAKLQSKTDKNGERWLALPPGLTQIEVNEYVAYKEGVA